MKILVAGAGHGGLIAASLLAKKGYSVTVLEKNLRENVGHSQTDAFDKSAFEYAGLELPKNFPVGRNRITFFPLDKTASPLTLPPNSEDSVIVDRKKLIRFLMENAEQSGAELLFSIEVKGALILGNRVVGLDTSRGEMYADLVIDACGVYSPVRKSLPAYTGVDREIKKYDVLHSYRATFEKIADAKQPDTYYNIYLRQNGDVGLCWVITGENDVDVLIARFPEIDDNEVLQTLIDLHNDNAQMGTRLLASNRYNTIPVCQPLAVIVADGYAAVGDSAFMTYPVKGSGIAYSIRAGKMLADTVEADKDGFFTAETLWQYQTRFYKEIGDGACRLALIKNMLPFMTAAEVSEIFKNKLVTSDELEKLVEEKLDALLSASAVSVMREKLKLLRSNAPFKELLVDLAVWLGRLTLIIPSLPQKYDRDDVAHWATKYNEFFESIRKKEMQ